MGAAPVGQAQTERPDALLKEFVAAYRRHLLQYEQWLETAESAMRKLDEDELDEFLSVHARKQAIAEGLQQDEQRLRRERERLTAALGLEAFTVQQLEERAASLPDSDSEAFQSVLLEWRGLLDELAATMQKVAKAERQIEKKLQRLLQSLSSSVSDARTTRRAVRAYASEGDSKDPRFIDRKS